MTHQLRLFAQGAAETARGASRRAGPQGEGDPGKTPPTSSAAWTGARWTRPVSLSSGDRCSAAALAGWPHGNRGGGSRSAKPRSLNDFVQRGQHYTRRLPGIGKYEPKRFRRRRYRISALLEHPRENAPSSHSGEIRFSARQSRFSLLTQGDVDPVTISRVMGRWTSSAPRKPPIPTKAIPSIYGARHLYLTVDSDFRRPSPRRSDLVAGDHEHHGHYTAERGYSADDRCAVRSRFRLAAHTSDQAREGF